ncbi:germination protein YpeB [Desulfolucanica intricata]|uniref:germination protein YpeB n=1 Tax=Desulfolucanica intricata TaxID=1285191 RepID=UPI0008309CC7|nr:germination protein YpeB [Desulfolucanica intricata]
MKRSFVLPTVLGLIAVMALGFWGFREQQMRRSLETYVNNSYQRSFYNAAEHVQNVEVLLGKSLLVPEKEYDGTVYNDIWQHANAAQENLTQLPVQQEIVGRTAKFLTQVGDYAHTLAARTGSDTEISDEKWQTLNKLYRQAGILNKELQAAQADILDGRVTIAEIVGESKRSLRGESKQLASNNFQKINQQMNEFPTLIYDGPFSDHLENQKAKGLTGKNITVSEARGKALKYTGQNQNGDRVVKVTDKTKGRISSYRVEINPRNNKNNRTIVDVSQKGGHLVWLVNTRELGERRISIDEARTKAEAYLKALGYKNMRDIYYERVDGAVTFIFVYMDKNIKIYPDQVKVTVALDKGDIIAVDASSYLMSHHKRDIGPPEITVAEARKAINHNVKIEGSRLVVIPLDAGGEKLAYEFEGVVNNENFLVYIDAKTGKQLKILKVINTPDGTLTM